MATKQQARLNKQTGSRFEGEVRKALRNLGQFVYTKGVSSKGIDILALKDNNIIFLELKSFVSITTTLLKESLHQFIIHDDIVDDLISRTHYDHNHVQYLLLMYERNNHFDIFHINGEMVRYTKGTSNIVASLEEVLTLEFNKHFKT